MSMNTGQFNNLYTRKIDEAFFEAWDEEPEQWSRIANKKTGDSNNHTTQIIAGIGAWQSKKELENPKQQRFKQGPLIVTEYEPFSVEIVMSREQIDDSRYGEVEDMTRDAGHAGRETVERNFANFMNEMYDRAFYDGQPIFSDAHPNFGDAGGTQDNKLTEALTDGSLKNAIILFGQQRDEGGKLIGSNPTKLVVPSSLQFTAATILQSALVAGTVNNDKNVIPDMELVVNKFWDSQKRWMIMGPRHKINHIWRVQPEFKKKPIMEDNGSQKWIGYFREANEGTNWRHTVGSDPA